MYRIFLKELLLNHIKGIVGNILAQLVPSQIGALSVLSVAGDVPAIGRKTIKTIFYQVPNRVAVVDLIKL